MTKKQNFRIPKRYINCVDINYVIYSLTKKRNAAKEWVVCVGCPRIAFAYTAVRVCVCVWVRTPFFSALRL